MAKVTRENLVKRLFSDTKNYPYGFSRSGDFSIAESKALSQFGCLIAALVDGEIKIETDEDIGFVEAAFGKRLPETTAEKAWVKYQKRINRPRLGSINGSKQAGLAEIGDAISDEHEITIEFDE